MNKIGGLELLENWNFPTLELLTINDLENNLNVLQEGVSVRLSSKGNDNIDVFLNSIHNVHDINIIKHFIVNNKDKYDIIIHKTVKPDIIGTVSKYSNNYYDIVVIELYNDFLDRSHGIISSRAVIEMHGNMVISVDNNSFEPKSLFYELVNYLKYIELDEYTIEFVIENKKLIFTDLYSNNIDDKKMTKC